MPDWGGKVAAWFGVACAASASLAALIASVAKPPLHGGPHDLFIALVVIAAVTFAALLLTGVLAVYVAWRNRGAHLFI